MLILASWWPARWSYAKLLYMQATQSGTIKKCSQGWPSSGPALLGARRASQMPDRKLMLLLRVPEHQATLAWIIDRAAAWSGYIKLMEDGKHELSRKARKEEPGLGYCNTSLTEELFSFFFFFFCSGTLKQREQKQLHHIAGKKSRKCLLCRSRQDNMKWLMWFMGISAVVFRGSP